LNLTRHTDFRTFAERDVLDSVQLASVIQPNEKILDFGSGGGVPGMVLGILRPDLDITFAECVGKKAHVLDMMTRELNLPIDVIDDRVENVIEGGDYQSLTARAVGPLPKMLPWFKESWNQFGRMLLIKGPRWVEEREKAEAAGLMKGITIDCLLSYPMPGRDSESVVLSLSKN
jgi:16S rRNA (guanine527-N7)-methyltransferase